MRLDLPPTLGGISKENRTGSKVWTKNENGDTIICSFYDVVKEYEFFPLKCKINREIDFGIRRKNQKL